MVFVDTGQHFPETLAYRDDLVARLGLTNVIAAEPNAETVAQEDPGEISVHERSGPLLRDP